MCVSMWGGGGGGESERDICHSLKMPVYVGQKDSLVPCGNLSQWRTRIV